MSNREFKPHIEVLPPPQQRLWEEFSAVPDEFVLYGGTALALHLGHRKSVDFDFFGSRKLDVRQFENRIPFLAGARVVQREENTFSAVVDRKGGVRVSFFGVPSLPRLAPPHIVKSNGLRVASLLDLAGTKASVVQVRAEAKDYIDLDALFSSGKSDLPLALAAAQKLYGSSFNPEVTLKALSYFDDGDLRDLPEAVRNRLATAAREVELERLPKIDLTAGRTRPDYGL
jgi:hypothetical protein